VSIDGMPVLDRLDGKPLALDPGVHRVAVERAGVRVESEIVAKVGEKNRVVPFAFLSPKAKVTSPSNAVAWALGGFGLLALGSFTFFAISGERQYQDLASNCAPRCDSGDARSVRTKFAIADISLGIGVVSIGVATAMLLTSPRSEERAVIDLRLLPGGGVASLSARF